MQNTYTQKYNNAYLWEMGFIVIFTLFFIFLILFEIFIIKNKAMLFSKPPQNPNPFFSSDIQWFNLFW